MSDFFIIFLFLKISVKTGLKKWPRTSEKIYIDKYLKYILINLQIIKFIVWY